MGILCDCGITSLSTSERSVRIRTKSQQLAKQRQIVLVSSVFLSQMRLCITPVMAINAVMYICMYVLVLVYVWRAIVVATKREI